MEQRPPISLLEALLNSLRLSEPWKNHERRVYVIHVLTLRFSGRDILKVGCTQYPEVFFMRFSRIRSYRKEDFPDGTALIRLNMCGEEQASDSERRLHWLAKSQVKGEFFEAAGRSKKTRETHAASEVAKVTSLLKSLARLNPSELHHQEVKRYQSTREGHVLAAGFAPGFAFESGISNWL